MPFIFLTTTTNFNLFRFRFLLQFSVSAFRFLRFHLPYLNTDKTHILTIDIRYVPFQKYKTGICVREPITFTHYIMDMSVCTLVGNQIRLYIPQHVYTYMGQNFQNRRLNKAIHYYYNILSDNITVVHSGNTSDNYKFEYYYRYRTQHAFLHTNNTTCDTKAQFTRTKPV